MGPEFSNLHEPEVLHDPRDGASLVVGVMAKFWQPGHVKTRLGRDVGMQTAALIHREFFRYLAQSLSSEAISIDFAASGAGLPQPRLEVAIAPPESLDEFHRALAEAGGIWNFVHQCSGELGERISHWFRSALAPPTAMPRSTIQATSATQPQADHAASLPHANDDPELRARQRALLIGCDCPLLSPRDLAESFERLQHHDLVLGPALDGGYYLIGLAGPYRPAHDRLFTDIPWSTSDVLRATHERAKEAGLSVAMLAPRSDVDQLSDLRALRQQLARPSAPPRQRKLEQRLQRLLRRSDASCIQPQEPAMDPDHRESVERREGTAAPAREPRGE